MAAVAVAFQSSGGQLEGVGAFLPLCGSQGSSSGHQTFQMPLLAHTQETETDRDSTLYLCIVSSGEGPPHLILINTEIYAH